MKSWSASRRSFLLASAAGAAAGMLGPAARLWGSAPMSPEPLFKISLAQWSLHRALQSKKIDNLDFARVAKEEFGIEAIEYVNQFFKDKATDAKYLAELNRRCDDLGVRQLLIMCDGEGALGDADPERRKKAVSNHHRWADAAKVLGCHSIRVNAQSSGSFEEQQQRAAEGLGMLAEYCAGLDLNVIVENHGGLSSHGAWLAGVMKMVGRDNCGTLPDFGNFRVSSEETYDRYRGVEELMPFAKAVSAKSHDFNDEGLEIHTDYFRMMKIVLAAGYRGYVGIEYEGGKLDEYEGIRATKRLLEWCLSELG